MLANAYLANDTMPNSASGLAFDLAFAVDEVTAVPVVAYADVLNVSMGILPPTVRGNATATAALLNMTVTPQAPTVVSDYLLSFDLAGVIDAGVGVTVPADLLAVYLNTYPVASVTGTALVSPNTLHLTANPWRPDMGWDTALLPTDDWTTRTADESAWESSVTVDSGWQTRT